MAERIVSAGVFTREKDLSFLPQGISEIGAAIIGPTQIGPAFIPTIIRNYQEFEEIFGTTTSDYYTPYAVEQYLESAGTVTIVRVLGLGGYTSDYLALQLSSSLGTTTAAVLAPSRGGSEGTAQLSGSSVTAASNFTETALTLSGSNWGAKGLTATSYTVSFDTSSANYIDKVFSSNPQDQTNNAYLYKNYKHHQSTAGAYSGSAVKSITSCSVADGSLAFSFDNTSDTFADNLVAYTPSVQSQLINGTRYSLFQVYTRSHGSDVNSKYNIVVSNVKAAGTVAGSTYGSFSLQVRKVDTVTWTQGNETILEQWDNLNFDPTSVNYFARVIGDQYMLTSSTGKLTIKGDWENKSKYIYVRNFTNIADSALPVAAVPMGHAAVSVPDPTTTAVPSASFSTDQLNDRNEFDSNYYFGFNYNNSTNREYLSAIPTSAGVGSNVSMSLEDFLGNDDASVLGTTYSDSSENITLTLSNIKQRKFVVPFQNGFNGMQPAIPIQTGLNITAGNIMGFDCTSATTSGSVAYKRAIDTVSNPDEYDINLLVTPGIIHGLHSAVTNYGISKVEARADAFYIMDAGIPGDSNATVEGRITALDTNYTSTYFPWVKIVDRNTSQPVWVPPTVVMPGVIAYTDQVAHEWFAPAGLNRGGLTSVVQVYDRLTHDERDDLYDARINPIAQFPGEGAVVWGQKTLQAKPSALDRVNVRRLLIKIRKFIASSSRYLVFEQNNVATRNRFLAIANPYLESIQQNSGLTAFRVVMDDTNNTADVIDRNQLVGQIFLQPTRTAEFIILDFVVLPTGASFPS